MLLDMFYMALKDNGQNTLFFVCGLYKLNYINNLSKNSNIMQCVLCILYSILQVLINSKFFEFFYIYWVCLSENKI